MRVKKQFVTVHVTYSEDAYCDQQLNGTILVHPRQVESVDVYGPFDNMKDAKADAKAIREMGEGEVFIKELCAPPVDESGAA